MAELVFSWETSWSGTGRLRALQSWVGKYPPPPTLTSFLPYTLFSSSSSSFFFFFCFFFSTEHVSFQLRTRDAEGTSMNYSDIVSIHGSPLILHRLAKASFPSV